MVHRTIQVRPRSFFVQKSGWSAGFVRYGLSEKYYKHMNLLDLFPILWRRSCLAR
jgi:hypothetical protein